MTSVHAPEPTAAAPRPTLGKTDKVASAHLSHLLDEYAACRRGIVSGEAEKAAELGRLVAIAFEVNAAERACDVGRDVGDGQALGELVKRPEFPALVRQVRELGARRAYAMHSLAAPKRTNSSVL